MCGRDPRADSGFEAAHAPDERADSRAKGWDGDSVELDAIPASLLRAMVDECIRGHVPDGHLEAMARVEAAERETLAWLAWISAAGHSDHGVVEDEGSDT
jgi:riboflavin synthase alpha subunit